MSTYKDKKLRGSKMVDGNEAVSKKNKTGKCVQQVGGAAGGRYVQRCNS